MRVALYARVSTESQQARGMAERSVAARWTARSRGSESTWAATGLSAAHTARTGSRSASQLSLPSPGCTTGGRSAGWGRRGSPGSRSQS
jgi:hypothetical protein